MSQDAMFLVITGLIVVALVVIGPVFVVWQYQRGGTPVDPGHVAATQTQSGESRDDCGSSP